MDISLYYFSGTGNTFLIANAIKDELESLDHNVELIGIEKADPTKISSTKVIGFGFPIAIHSTYPFVREFIEQIKMDASFRIFAFATMAGTKSGIFNYFLNLRKQLGFTILGIENFRMPNNFFPKSIDSISNEERVEESLIQARMFARSLVDSTQEELKKDFVSRIYNPISHLKGMWSMVRKIYPFSVDYEKCSKCNLCIHNCPVKNITRRESQIIFEDRCELCMRCISYCPQHAIFVPEKDYQLYQRNIQEPHFLRNPPVVMSNRR
jgi:ferredoxin